MKIIVNDKMQKNYTYETSEPIGQNFAPDFLPELTPAEMLHMGVFEGKYLNDCRNEFPADWFRNAALAPADCQCRHKLLSSEITPVPAGMAKTRLDLRPGSPRLVSMVLPLLSRSPPAGN